MFISRSSGLHSSVAARPKITARPALSTAACHTLRRTSCSSFAPKAWAIGMEKPEQKPRHRPITRKFTEPVAPTAASFSVPR